MTYPLSIQGEMDILTFDPAVSLPIVGIKAIWFLYRNGRWSLLRELGFNRAEFEPLFIGFDLRHITSERGLLRSHRQAIRFLAFIPEGPLRQQLLEAAMDLERAYTAITRGDDD